MKHCPQVEGVDPSPLFIASEVTAGVCVQFCTRDTGSCWTEFSEGSQICLRALLLWKFWVSRNCSEKKGSGGILPMYRNACRESTNKDGVRLLSLVPRDRTRGSGHRHTDGSIWTSGNFFFFFTVRVTKDWNRLPWVVKFTSWRC